MNSQCLHEPSFIADMHALENLTKKQPASHVSLVGKVRQVGDSANEKAKTSPKTQRFNIHALLSTHRETLYTPSTSTCHDWWLDEHRICSELCYEPPLCNIIDRDSSPSQSVHYPYDKFLGLPEETGTEQLHVHLHSSTFARAEGDTSHLRVTLEGSE